MLRRILITACLLLTLATLSLWPLSYFRALTLRHTSHAKGWLTTSEWGSVYFTWCDSSQAKDSWGWSTYRAAAEPSHTGYNNSHHFAGFAYFYDQDDPPWGLQWGFYFPLWFPPVFSAGLLWLAWHRSKKINPRIAFPVQPPQPAPKK